MFNKTYRVTCNTNVSNYCLIVVELNGIERQLIKFGQARCLKQLRKKLEENLPLFKSVCSAAILKRTPILLDDVIRMQGRLSKAPVAFDVHYPILLPINSRLSQSIVDSCNQICGHSGLNHRTFSVLRNQYCFIVCFFVLFAIFILHLRESELYHHTLDGKSALACELPFSRFMGHLSST